MSEAIKHECGIAFIRLLKPLQYYVDKYGTALYGLNKMYLLMEKQHNRGQDGAGVATVKLDTRPGVKYISRLRSTDSAAIKSIFERINGNFARVQSYDPAKLKDVNWLKDNLPFTGELLLGHLRYGTYGKNSLSACHPFLRRSNWRSRNLLLAGNFNLTNVSELFQNLVELGQYPKERSDSVTMLEKIGHFLDEENNRILQHYRALGCSDQECYRRISEELDVASMLRRATKKWDGGYVISGLLGHGDAFVLRDPNGIRPAYYYQDDEVLVVASERPAIQTAFNVPIDSLQELTPGQALIVKKNGKISFEQINDQLERKSCSFERIYFSRGSDASIYKERKKMGELLLPAVLESVDQDVDRTVFAYIPNTAEVAFYGLAEALHKHVNLQKKQALLDLGNLDSPEADAILARMPRVEKVALKDAKLRTFITDDSSRDDLVAHVYDTTYGVVQPGDHLVVIDDSIVRGTTLKQSILKILDRLKPQRIVVVSSAPQIRYPDCYGIDMAKLGDFIAFQAAIALLQERGLQTLVDDVYRESKEMLSRPDEDVVNVVQKIYAPFSPEEISDKIAQLLKPVDTKAEVRVVYQKLEDLHIATPNHPGDWYFSGNYPTPGGNRVVCQSFVNYIEGRNERAY
jgi:amidophosphoribosyltransferase